MPARNESNLHGSAELHESSEQEIGRAFNVNGSTALPLGHNPGNRNKGLAYDLGKDGNKGHALTFGATRSGKGVSAIIPALLTYEGSMVVIDPKGENAWITADRRRAMGQRVVIIDPWDEVNKRFGNKAGIKEEVTKFNPLSALDPDSPDFADDVSSIAEAFILQTGNDPHWPDSARELVAGLIAAIVERNPGRASMRQVRRLIQAPIRRLRDAIDEITEKTPNSIAAGKLAAFVEMSPDGKSESNDKEISSIRSTARTQTAFLDSRYLVDSMDTDDPPFNLEELATGRVTLYLVLPVNKLKSHGRWLRMILTLAIMAVAKQDTPPKLPVTLVLDELGTISPGSGLSMIEQSYGLMSGLGIRIWGFLQDLPQLQRDYPASWETFISNSSIIQLLDVADDTTAKYFSGYMGNGTVEINKGWSPHVRPVKQGGDPNQQMGKAHSILAQVADNLNAQGGVAANTKREVWEAELSYHPRPVLFSWELRESPSKQSIVIMPGIGNYRLQRFIFYSDPVLSQWARPDPNRKAADSPVPPAVASYTAPIASLPAPAPASAGDVAKDVAKDIGRAGLRFLQNRLNNGREKSDAVHPEN